jgi:hypothetical protein
MAQPRPFEVAETASGGGSERRRRPCEVTGTDPRATECHEQLADRRTIDSSCHRDRPFVEVRGSDGGAASSGRPRCGHGEGVGLVGATGGGEVEFEHTGIGVGFGWEVIGDRPVEMAAPAEARGVRRHLAEHLVAEPPDPFVGGLKHVVRPVPSSRWS